MCAICCMRSLTDCGGACIGIACAPSCTRFYAAADSVSFWLHGRNLKLQTCKLGQVNANEPPRLATRDLRGIRSTAPLRNVVAAEITSRHLWTCVARLRNTSVETAVTACGIHPVSPP